MGAVTNTAVTTRGRVHRRAVAELAGRAERDTRIQAAAAQVATSQDTIRANAERRALAVAAAQRAISAAERDERDANTAADEQIRAAVGQLRADALTVAEIAELTRLPVTRVRQLVKHPRARASATADAAGTPGGAAVRKKQDG